MKIAFSYLGCHRRGGVERIVLECARWMSGRGHDVHVWTREWDESPEYSIQFHRVPAATGPSFRSGLQFKIESEKMLRDQDFDVLSTHGVICPTNGVLWTQSVHRSWLDKSREHRGAWSSSGLKQRINPVHRVILALEEEHYRQRKYGRIVATTEYLRDDLKKYYDVPSEDVDVIPNGFNPNEFSPQVRASRRAEMRAQLGLGPNDIALLFAANELERKGYRTILEAMKRLNRPEIKLVAIGRTSRHEAVALAKEFGVQDRVLVQGSSSDVAGYHAAADLFVLPTQYEAFCLAILESLGSGLPVLTTRVPGAQDAIVPNVNGALIDDPKSGEQLAHALAPFLERDYREQVTSTTPATSDIYQWPRVFEQYETILQRWAKTR